MAKSYEAPASAVRDIVLAALAEDMGWGGEDYTTNATVPEDINVEARCTNH